MVPVLDAIVSVMQGGKGIGEVRNAKRRLTESVNLSTARERLADKGNLFSVVDRATCLARCRASRVVARRLLCKARTGHNRGSSGVYICIVCTSVIEHPDLHLQNPHPNSTTNLKPLHNLKRHLPLVASTRKLYHPFRPLPKA